MTNDKDDEEPCCPRNPWCLGCTVCDPIVDAFLNNTRQPTQSDALREALERIGVGMMPPEIIEGKLTLRLMRVDIAQEQSK